MLCETPVYLIGQVYELIKLSDLQRNLQKSINVIVRLLYDNKILIMMINTSQPNG